MVAEAAAELARRGEAPCPRADRRDDRDSGRGLHGGSARAGSGLLHDRHQRSDSVLPGGRSRGRARLAAVRAAASGDPAGDRHGAPRGGAAADSGVALRRDGVGPRAADAARRPRADRVQHDAGRDRRRQAGARGGAHGRSAGAGAPHPAPADGRRDRARADSTACRPALAESRTDNAVRPQPVASGSRWTCRREPARDCRRGVSG